MKIKKNKIAIVLFEISLIFLLLQHCLFPSELTFISLFFSIVTGIFVVVKEGKIHLNPFIISYTIFAIYATIDTAIRGDLEDNLPTLIMYYMQLLSSLCIYNYITKEKKVHRFFNIYIIVSVISLAIMFILLGENAVLTRLGHNGSGAKVSYLIFDTPIYKSSNGTANFCAIATFLLLYYAELKNKKYCYIPIIFLTIGLLLCGSRKGILIYIIYIIYTYFFMKKGITIKKALIFLFIPIIIYITIMKIPVIYNSIGKRVESIVLNIFNVSNTLDENSYIMRQQMKQEAMEWIKEKPIMGQGFRMFTNKYGYGAENNVLQIMADFGIIGALIYYSFMPSLIFNVIKNIKGSIISKIMTIMIITILIQDYGSVTYSWQHMTMWYSIFWAIIKLEEEKQLVEDVGGEINYEK